VKAGFIQMTPEFGQIERNLDIAGGLVRRHPADLLVLPEFFNTGYLFVSHDEVRALAESIPGGPTTEYLRNLASETGSTLVAGLPERDGETLYNTAVLVSPDGTYRRYRKTHLFDREKLFFTPGDTGFQVVDTRTARIGLMICFDWFFPESARTLALGGAQIIAHPANLVLPHCPQAMVTRCLENRVFAVTANRAGTENRDGMQLTYIGNSRVIGPDGRVLAACGDESAACRVVEIDPGRADSKRLNDRNDLFHDRRTAFYELGTD